MRVQLLFVTLIGGICAAIGTSVDMSGDGLSHMPNLATVVTVVKAQNNYISAINENDLVWANNLVVSISGCLIKYKY